MKSFWWLVVGWRFNIIFPSFSLIVTLWEMSQCHNLSNTLAVTLRGQCRSMSAHVWNLSWWHQVEHLSHIFSHYASYSIVKCTMTHSNIPCSEDIELLLLTFCNLRSWNILLSFAQQTTVDPTVETLFNLSCLISHYFLFLAISSNLDLLFWIYQIKMSIQHSIDTSPVHYPNPTNLC